MRRIGSSAQPPKLPLGLAIFGRAPVFPRPLYVGRPNIGDRHRLFARFTDILDRQWLTNDGPMVKEFERRISEYHQVKHCVATCNGTVALELLCRALGLAGEVIVPSFTFVATAHALQWQQVTPVFADIDPSTHMLDPRSVEDRISSRTTGIIGVHLWGRTCEVGALQELASNRGLKLIFDAAHALGCSHKGVMVGSFGEAEIFSFHATKVVNSFEGGAIVTNDDALAEKLKLMRNFGFAGYDKVIHLGINGKMCEFSAAMGLTCLEEMERFIESNRKNYGMYATCLKPIRAVRLLSYQPLDRNNFQYVVAEIDETETVLTRDEIIDILHAENVLARRYFWPGCHRMEPYRTLYPEAGRTLRQTDKVSGKVIVLPTGPSIGPDDINLICQILRAACENGPEIAMRMRTKAQP